MERNYDMPREIAQLCGKLRRGGYAAYPVGGAVRDLVMGRTPGDWDVTTAAPPAMTAALFAGTARPTGLAHGTVTVDTGIGSVEVTTFRREGPYSDGRRPDWVLFVRELFYDLIRRDFTMNAMALDADGSIIDPFGGRADLERKIIRTVGAPDRRVKEDGLRLFRAVRFAAQLDFDLGEDEKNALMSHSRWGGTVSPERARVEVEKGLCGIAPARLEMAFASGLMDRFLDVPAVPVLSGLADVPATPIARWGALCDALTECGVVCSPEEFLRRFHMEKKTVKAVGNRI